MYYCFVKEDLEMMSESDPLLLQARYAIRLGEFLCLDMRRSVIVDQDNNMQNVRGETVLLRTTCSNIENAIATLKSLGANLVETKEDVLSIENWFELQLTRRQIFSIPYKDILGGNFSEQVRTYLKNVPRIFIKSKEKGYCVKMPSFRLLNQDEEVRDFFKQFMDDIHAEVLLTEELSIKSDSLGNKESRHIVRSGRIANSSRNLHSLKHAVPKTLLLKAQEVVTQISDIERFPKNYILDLGLFEKDGEVFADVVEINPLTTSLCYVNNSIFDEEISEIQELKHKWNMGVEYCYDMLEHPQQYVESRSLGEKYSYLNEEHYEFE